MHNNKNCISFLFFQAEHGIRALYVTGVQTCALPIFQTGDEFAAKHRFKLVSSLDEALADLSLAAVALATPHSLHRSEERRVGKECSYRWWRYLYNEDNSCASSCWFRIVVVDVRELVI